MDIKQISCLFLMVDINMYTKKYFYSFSLLTLFFYIYIWMENIDCLM